jgi:anti-anti-sigma factor
MNITQDAVDGNTILHLEGRFDFGVRKTFKEAVDGVSVEGSSVVLDLEKVAFVDSSALGLLVICHQNLKNKNVSFCLVNPQTYVKQVLDLANIGKMIPIYQTLAEVPKRIQVPTGAPA